MNLSNATHFYKGKVRDVYTIADKYILMHASNRISAFDVILPRTIPFKGQVLNQTAAFFLNQTKHIVQNWLIDVPMENVSFGYKCIPIPIEVVVRNYLTGHAWREYSNGKRKICGVVFPEGLKEHQQLPTPVITPTTKANEGHDLDISKEEIIAQGLVNEKLYAEIEQKALALFKHGSDFASEKGLILVDTKYEFGLLNGQLCLMDEIHTPDSSRYFLKDSYHGYLNGGAQPEQLSKEFVRQWLIQNNFMGKEGQTVPQMDDEWVNSISEKYIRLYESITGLKFHKMEEVNENEMEVLLNKFLAGKILK